MPATVSSPVQTRLGAGSLAGVTVDRSPLIAVVGATGGCGVTTIALHLARSHRSCVIECGAHAGLAERAALDRGRLLGWGPDDAVEGLHLAALPMRGGFRAVFAKGDTAEGVERVADVMAARFDSVVLDLPFGHDPPMVCDAAVVVLPATIPGALRARPVLARVESLSCAVIANRVGPGGEALRGQLQRTLRRRITLELPPCAALRDVEDEGALLAPGRAWSRRFERLARALRRPPGARPATA